MSMPSDRERIEKLIENVMSVAKGDFTVQNELSGKNDDLDALAIGLNMMIDDLRNSIDIEAQNKRIKAINEELIIAKKKAQESDRLKSAFLANMSHEIRSPMNAIIGFSALLGKDNISPEKRKEYTSFIENSGRQLMALIDDIIDISKIESNQLKINREFQDLNKLLRQIFEIAKQDRRLQEKPDLRLLLNRKSECNCFINTDQLRFKQIFNNLITNAIKFTEKGYIEIGYTTFKDHGQDMVKLFVRDTGIGIPDNMKEVIFDRFRQVHDQKFEEGTGLGLSITKGLVDLLDGEIKVESEINKGSVFYITFPYTRIRKPINNKPLEEVEGLPLNLSNYTIYIAEDKLDSYILLREFLKSYGPKIKYAQNGQELINMVRKEPPDLLLLDIHMPVKNGYETIKELRANEYTFPVIAQTAYAMADERERILNSGCNGCISKPIDPEVLIQEIKKQLNIKH